MSVADARGLLRRLPATALAAVLLASGAPATLAQGGASTSPNPGTGVPVDTSPPGPMSYSDRATPLVPRPGSVTDPALTPWDHVTISPDGRTLTVFFWSGAEACYGLDHVELTDVDGTLSIALFTGFRVDAANVRCRDLAQLYSTIVELEAPLLGGGLPGVEGAVLAPDEGELALPGATLVQSEPHPWDAVQVGPDGRSLWAWYTGGAAPCFGLGRVELTDADGTPVLVLQTGPTDADAVCIAIAVAYRTPVALDAPILLGGAS